MTTNKPEVVAYRYTASRSFGKRNPKWHYQESFPHAENREVEEIGRLEELIRLSDYEALQAENEALRKDADRYRWLRTRWGRIADEYDGDSDQLVAIREADSHFEGWDVDPLSLDRAIDAAMAKVGEA